MRLRHNINANETLKTSGFLLKNFPIKISKNTIIELGMGKGTMITQLAKLNPNNIYIGIEKYETVAAVAAKKASLLNLKNFFIICEDIAKINELFIGKVDTIWLTFSDPWPKNRHEKRRLTYKKFIDKYEHILSSNGLIKFKTDNNMLFEYSLESFKNRNWKLKNVTNDFHNHLSSKNNIMTDYEIKWSNKGKLINYLEVYK